MKDNHVKFPDNIYPPEEIVIDDAHCILYRSRFNNLYSLYNYLVSDPEINKSVFSELHSITGSESFAGKPYEVALEDLIGEVDKSYETFLKLQKDLVNSNKKNFTKFKTVRTVAGGRLNIPLYSAGIPECYETEERISMPKFCRIYVNLSYNWMTSKEQVLNRALVLLNVIRALENASYIVDLNLFDLSELSNEIFYFILQVKKFGNNINMEMLYKAMCCTEFLRRIIFRVMETMAFKRNWGEGYGRTCDDVFTRKFLKLKKDDLLFPQPSEMNIKGKDIVKDFKNALNYLQLDDKVDSNKLVYELKKRI